MENDQNAQKRKCNVDPISKSQAKAHYNEAFGPSIDVEMAQAHRGNDHVNAVANAVAPLPMSPGLGFLWLLHVAMLRRSMVVSKNT